MKRALHLIMVLLTLAGLALGAFQLAHYGWDQMAEYQGPFTGALPSGEEGQPLVLTARILGSLGSAHRGISKAFPFNTASRGAKKGGYDGLVA